MPTSGDLFYANFTTGSVVVASATAVQLLPVNNDRNAFWIFNHSNASCFVSVGASASLTNFSFKLASGSFVQVGNPCPRGQVTAIWDAAAGSAMVTSID